MLRHLVPFLHDAHRLSRAGWRTDDDVAIGEIDLGSDCFRYMSREKLTARTVDIRSYR